MPLRKKMAREKERQTPNVKKVNQFEKRDRLEATTGKRRQHVPSKAGTFESESRMIRKKKNRRAPNGGRNSKWEG